MPAFSIAGGIMGQNAARGAQSDANAAGAQAWDRALDMASANKALASPYLFAGYAGTNALLKAMGLGHLNPFNTDGGTRSTAYGETSLNTSDVAGDRANALKDFRASPGYTFRRDQGVQALDRSALSKGMLQSGAQTQAVQEYGQKAADDEWSSYIARLMGLSGQGAGVATNTNSVNTNALTSGNSLNTSSMLQGAKYGMDAGNALANGIMNAGNSLMSMVGYTGLGRNSLRNAL